MGMREHHTLVRQALYRFLGGMLLYPETERFEILKAGAVWLADILTDQPLAQSLGLGAQLRVATTWIQNFEGDFQYHQSEWIRLFGSSQHDYCFPYEGAYRGPQAAGPVVASLLKEYARAGLTLSTSDLPDHISVELEYMSYLCGMELETSKSGETVRQERILNAQRLFLENHLCQWLPSLMKRVIQTDGGPFALVCATANQVTATDHARLGSEWLPTQAHPH